MFPVSRPTLFFPATLKDFIGFFLKKKIRGMAGKFVDTSAIRKGNALLKKRFA